jgi:hypothetical protein
VGLKAVRDWSTALWGGARAVHVANKTDGGRPLARSGRERGQFPPARPVPSRFAFDCKVGLLRLRIFAGEVFLHEPNGNEGSVLDAT